MIELLSPAGDLEKLKIALHYGADAVYIGGRNFGLRANAKNFSNEEIKEAVIVAHSLNKKVYVTVNIIFHDEDFNGLEEYLLYLDSINVDAIMVSDVSVLELCNNLNLKLERYISTQASTLNEEAALFYKSLGVKRIVLAREAMKEDIIKIKQATNLDLEAFIQGAMCTSISGRCIMSNYCTNRDANRGGCAQICRWIFNYIDPDTNELVCNNFQIASKDLNMAENIQSMIESGINSFKIEGRMRSIYYIATVLLIYRNIFNKIKDNKLTDEYIKYATKILNRCANRESVSQFYDKFPTEKEQYYIETREEASNQDFLGIVLSNESDIITIEQRNHFTVGQNVQFIGPNIDTIDYKIDKIYDENLEEIDVANHPQMIIKIKAKMQLEKDDIMRVKLIDF